MFTQLKQQYHVDCYWILYN